MSFFEKHFDEIILGTIIGTIVAWIGFIFGLAMPTFRYIRKRYMLTHSFKLKFKGYDYNTGDFMPNTIIGSNGTFYFGDHKLTITMREEKILDQINIRFVEKRWFGNWLDAPKEIVSIEGFHSLDEKNYTKLTDRKSRSIKDNRGGLDIAFFPPCQCPKDDILHLGVSMHINVVDKWEGFLSVQHLKGGSVRTYGRKKISIINKVSS